MARNVRQHPVFQLLVHVGQGGTSALPSAAELDALNLPADVRRKIERACADVAELRDEGANQAAWEAAEEVARTIIDGLTHEQQDPDYLEADPLEGVTDPDELAAAVPRF